MPVQLNRQDVDFRPSRERLLAEMTLVDAVPGGHGMLQVNAALMHLLDLVKNPPPPADPIACQFLNSLKFVATHHPP
jgi:hypothetical protein